MSQQAQTRPKIVPLGRIIRAADVKLYNSAVAAYQNAADEAELILERARREAIGIREAARAEGEAAGKSSVASALLEASRAAQISLANVASDVADAIAEGVASVIGELDLHDAVARAARLALSDLRERHGVVVFIAAASYEAVTAALSEYESVEVRIDPTMAADECEIRTSGGQVRAGLGQQVATIRAALQQVSGR